MSMMLVTVLVLLFFVLVMVMVSMLVPVFMLVLMLMILLQMDVELHSLNIRLLLSSRMQVVALQLEFAQLPLQLFEVDAQIEHRANEHVAADAAENIQVNSLHFSSPAASALIWLAAKPAPNPLLMFTTVSPLLQLLSIASNAVNPPRCAP